MTKTMDPPAKQYARFGRADGADPVIDRAGGKYGAGIIRGVSLAAVGEALGHEMWLDQITIEQVAEYAQGKAETGLKCRFTHPGLCSDGMGRHLGRLMDVRVEGEKAVGDLHFAESAHSTPDGDLAEYVMLLTDEDPAAAGLSIVFHHDFESEDAFGEAHQEDYEYEDRHGRTVKTKRFKSPDDRNEHGYPHVRLSELRAADVVDEPAANPDGLFDRSPLARQADEFLSYAAGISDTKPQSSAFDVDGDRASQFFAHWLSSHGLSLVSETELAAMAKTETPDAPAAPEVTRESLLAEQKRYTDKFGAEDGVNWFTDGKSYEEALELFCDKQAAALIEAQGSLSEAQEKLSSINLGEEHPIETHPGDESKKVSFAEYTRARKN
ncbi:hypothetical protein Enr13x_42390 [Stieleria neptunia]|uniref:Uncharacterized protein n=1 Tax=Stieleria neptunia TaxID=2527979 RepID=A0A518HU78_9BACT|nr:hypothetical protein [Stieleria neptunia]QDV44374.1 hypothetical protein Enr13x_42390 [Stieleria neptunia]